ncbi:hypothetical protein KC19_10G044300 [Ceratodon purpureus]|uniref:NADP-dependent oxidoreductase domain-containing protein n=1 Tax=Ceratodon purpureus TaxID=3225 RepID=A0A8T0GKE6_CERPU|nr:hypothetical protein KC19_10G044300 [Ceratodon purpureus]
MCACVGPALRFNHAGSYFGTLLPPNVGSLNSSSRTRVACSAKLNTNLDSSTEVMKLGRSDLQVSRLGIGTLQWGDPGSGFGTTFGEAELASAFDEIVAGGINFFDTAEVYGYQNIKSGSSSEQLLGKFLREKNQGGKGLPPVIATKFFTIPWTNFLVGGGFRLGRKSLLAALRESLKRIGKERVDLYQIHFPFPTFSNAALMESLKEAVEEGLTRAVGVSNFSKEQMEEADDLLSQYGIPLTSNQVQYSLASQDVEENGLLKACQDRNIQLIAYSPLASGLLTDKALTRTDGKATKIQPLLKLMQSIGREHGDKSVTQVALNYLICKGALPIAGCKNAQQAKAHCEVLKFKLTDDQVASLQEKARTLKL